MHIFCAHVENDPKERRSHDENSSVTLLNYLYVFMKTVNSSRYKKMFLRSLCLYRMLESANSVVFKLTYYLKISC